MTRDPRLRSAVLNAAPRIVSAILHKDDVRLERELKRLDNRCGYLVARRALDNAIHCPEALKHALASAAPGLARAASSGERRDATAAALHFVETLVGEGIKRATAEQLHRVPVRAAVKEAFVSASPGLVLAAMKRDGRLATTAGAHLASDLVEAHAAPVAAEKRKSDDVGQRLQAAALDAAPHAAFAAVRRTRGDAARAVVEFVGRAGVVTVDHVADKFIRGNAEDIFAARRSAQGLVKELVMHQWLQKREFVLPAARSLPGIVRAAAIPEPHLAIAAGMVEAHPIWRQAWTHVVYTTPQAADRFAVPLPPDLRRAFIPHYLRTMDACLALEKRYEARGFKVVSITGENQLIRESFAGQVFRKGRVVPKFPDAQLVVRGPDGTTETVNVEYVTKAYTPAMIAAKASAFKGPTVWAVDAPSTGAKVAAVAGADADLLLV